ncbi:LacI family DNA-binding transcriptional regulator [Halpernia frigidisoli]|uniref:Transcriptional regulator, LacI family n=1 Tax=Halpernia frigidisoli TaxID=1125876 RepID=A0A1I3IWF2_9FLAO|nr:LacI family DNA-binding transcriptional regulator [Halpernia frigidisoli]SFI52198.1 transcriptional regulator, LacI family [Halpernia frigidisoli]
MQRKSTIYDIAAKLNVSVATVSRALNDKPNISAKTKKLVLKTAAEMHYEQNLLAVALKSGRSQNVGVIVPRIDSYFFSTVIKGIEEALNPYHYNVIICQTYRDKNTELTKIEALLNSQVDAIFISTSNDNEAAYERVLEKNVPLIFFDRTTDIETASSVTINDFEGGYQATKHLINSGCKKIAHFSGDQNIPIFRERFLGYRKALDDFAIDYNENLVIKTRSSLEEGKNAVKNLISQNILPDAIFSAIDYAALGAIQELQEGGYKIPEEISVIGFSNEPFTKFMELSITTINQFPLEMGKMAAQIFLEQLDSADAKIIKKVVLNPELILRKTTKEISVIDK